MGAATKACAGPAAEAATEPAPLAMTRTGGWLDFQVLRGRARSDIASSSKMTLYGSGIFHISYPISYHVVHPLNI